MKTLLVLLSSCILVACGGGSSDSLTLMVDSLGRTVPEGDFGGGDGGAAGADGSAGDGKPIANAPVTVRDNAGHTVNTTTDALGYYRVNVKGFTPPFVAKVTRADGSTWYSPSVTPVKVRGFVTMNITGLADTVASDAATSLGLNGGAAQLTPAVVAANTSTLQAAKTKLNVQLATNLANYGLGATNFDPVTTPYKAVATDGYDKLLESVVIAKDVSGVTVVKTAVEGNWVRTDQATNYIRNGVPQPDYAGNTSTVAGKSIRMGEPNYQITPPASYTAVGTNGLTENCSSASVTGPTSYNATCTYTDATTNYSVSQTHNFISFVGCGACAVGSKIVRVQTEAVTSLPGGTNKGAPLVPFSDSLTWTYTYTRIN